MNIAGSIVKQMVFSKADQYCVKVPHHTGVSENRGPEGRAQISRILNTEP